MRVRTLPGHLLAIDLGGVRSTAGIDPGDGAAAGMVLT
jgi:hypothetical protein